jgi:hypothetical protein
MGQHIGSGNVSVEKKKKKLLRPVEKAQLPMLYEEFWQALNWGFFWMPGLPLERPRELQQRRQQMVAS